MKKMIAFDVNRVGEGEVKYANGTVPLTWTHIPQLENGWTVFSVPGPGRLLQHTDTGLLDNEELNEYEKDAGWELVIEIEIEEKIFFVNFYPNALSTKFGHTYNNYKVARRAVGNDENTQTYKFTHIKGEPLRMELVE